MTIQQILAIVEGTEVGLAGTITYVDPQVINKVGRESNKPYQMQLLGIRDATSDFITVNMFVRPPYYTEANIGQPIAVIGTKHTYKGEVSISFASAQNQQRQQGPPQRQQGPQQPRQAPNAPIPAPQRPQNAIADHERRVKNRGICLSYALEHLTIPLLDAYAAALEMADFIETGIIPKPQQEQNKSHSPEDDYSNYDASNVPDPDPSIIEEDSVPF